MKEHSEKDDRQQAFTVYVKRSMRAGLQEVKSHFLLPKDSHAASHCIKAGLEVFKSDPERFKQLVAS